MDYFYYFLWKENQLDTQEHLASDRVDGLGGLLDGAVEASDDHVNNDGEEAGEEGGERVLGTTVLGNLHELGDSPTDEIHPRHGGGERETRNDGVESLGLELLGDEINSFEGSRNGGHL